jgi:excisionase family DNA binding protein
MWRDGSMPVRRRADLAKHRSDAGGAAPSELIDIDEAANRLGVTVRFLRRLVDERRIPCRDLGQQPRFDPADIDHFHESLWNSIDSTASPVASGSFGQPVDASRGLPQRGSRSTRAGRRSAAPILSTNRDPVGVIDAAIERVVAHAVAQAAERFHQAALSPPSLVFTVAQAAEALQVSSDTINRLIKKGNLSKVPHVDGKTLIPRQSVERLIAESDQRQGDNVTTLRRRGAP